MSDIQNTFTNPPYLMKIQRPNMPGVVLDQNVYIEMRDNTRIAADVFRPEKAGRYPALLSAAVYTKDIQQYHPGWCHSIEAGATGFYVPKGYVHVICQSRGSGLSQGQWSMLDHNEQQDTYDMVEWIAKQPWCDGNVGMIGDSYWAWIQWLAAEQKPPHLKCIVPHDGGMDRYRDDFYPGGIFNGGGFISRWVPDTINQCLWPGPVEGKLPPANLIADVSARPEDGPYYWERSAYNKIDQIEVPVLSCVALTALHSRAQLAAYPNLKTVKKLIIEPEAGRFAHLRFLTNRPLNQYILRWLDYWLKGIDTGILNEPEVAIFDNATRKWRYENEYPLKRTEWTKFYFHTASGTKATEPPYGSISMEPPANEKPDHYKLPESGQQLLAGKPVLAFGSAILGRDIKVWGPLSAVIYGSSTTTDTDWFIKIKDIGPDGKTRLLNNGVLRASFRDVDKSKSLPGQPFHTFQKPTALVPNEIYEFQIEIRPIFYTFKAGHRIWVEIASDDLDFFMPLHTTDLLRTPWPAENRVYHDSEHPSHILLPVIPDSAEIRKVESPLSEVEWPLVSGTKWPTSHDGWLSAEA